MNKIKIIIACSFFFALGFFITINQEANANNAMMGSCGTGIECYSVPDGCGVGVGCIKAWCTHSKCPSVTGGLLEDCYFCDDDETIDPGG